MPGIDEVVVLPLGKDWRGAPELLRTLMRIRAAHFDVAIDFTTPFLKWVSFVGAIPRRTYMKFDRLWWLIPRGHDRWRKTHAAEHYYHCARELDLPPWASVSRAPVLTPPATARADADSFLRAIGRSEGRPLVGIHPGGAGLAGLKRWPSRAFAAAADQLHERADCEILLLGGAHERELAARITAQMRYRPLDATGRVRLLTSFGLIAACDLFIGNDSSLLHAAAAVGTRYVGIFGPTSPDSFGPIAVLPGQGRLVQPDPPCVEPRSFVGSTVLWDRPRCAGQCAALAQLHPERVVSAAAELLDVSTCASARRTAYRAESVTPVT